MRWLTTSPYVPLIAWSAMLFLLTQVYKLATRAAGIRHHHLVERTLPIVPVALGALTGAAFPDLLGLTAVVDGGSVPRTLGAVYGVGVGFASSGVFRAVLDAVPGGAKLRDRLTVAEKEESCG